MLYTKICFMIRYVECKERTIRALSVDCANETIDEERGRKNFLRIFQYMQNQAARDPQQPEFTRIIGNQLVGRPLPRGTGTARLAVNDPRTCEHPDQHMRQRGNAKVDPQTGRKTTCLWWTCQLCNSRWERKAVPQTLDDDDPSDSDPILFGKHVGLTYLEVYNQYPKYCSWVLETAENDDKPSAGLLRLASYLLFHAPTDPPTAHQQVETNAQELGRLVQQRRMEELQHHQQMQVLAQAAPFPDSNENDEWMYTEEEMASMDAGHREHLASCHVALFDEPDPDL